MERLLDDFEIPISDASDFELPGSPEFPEAEMIEPVGDVSDEIPIQEDEASFQEPEFSESGSDGDLWASVDGGPPDNDGSVEVGSDLTESEHAEVPVYDEPIEEISRDEINSQSDQMGSEQIPEEEEFVSGTTHEQVSVGEEIDSETTYEQEPEADDSVPETTPEQVSEDDQTDSKTTSEIIRAEDEVRPEALEPNIVYERNGYEYKTDELGRTQLVTADLDLTKGERTPLQTEVGHMGVDGDEGGHLIGTRFNGPTDAFNLVPQDANLNRGEWKAMENSWADALSNGQDVKVMIEPVYGDDAIRPESFEVISQVDGELTYTSFLNQPGSKTKGEKNG